MRVGKLHTALIAGALTATGLLGVATPAVAQPAATVEQQQAVKAPRGTLASTVTGTFTDATGSAGVVDGTFKPTRFTARNGKLLATGTLTANLVDAAGQKVGTTTRTVTLPVVLPAQDAALAQAADCQILNLVLGPLDLDLLGLKVHLDRVVLDITAQSGSGNLLGNLLCAVAGLLDGGGSLGAISALLNSILGLLRL